MAGAGAFPFTITSLSLGSCFQLKIKPIRRLKMKPSKGWEVFRGHYKPPNWEIICKGKVISKHIDLHNAERAVKRHLKNKKIDNTYSIKQITRKLEEK